MKASSIIGKLKMSYKASSPIRKKIETQKQLLSKGILLCGWEEIQEEIRCEIEDIEKFITALLNVMKEASGQLSAWKSADFNWNSMIDEASRSSYEACRSEANKIISRTEIRRKVFARDGYRCVVCYSKKNLSVDHKIPVVAGGSNELENLQTLCAKCNSSKGSGGHKRGIFVAQSNVRISEEYSKIYAMANAALKEARHFVNSQLKIQTPKIHSKITEDFIKWLLTYSGDDKLLIYKKAEQFCLEAKASKKDKHGNKNRHH